MIAVRRWSSAPLLLEMGALTRLETKHYQALTVWQKEHNVTLQRTVLQMLHPSPFSPLCVLCCSFLMYLFAALWLLFLLLQFHLSRLHCCTIPFLLLTSSQLLLCLALAIVTNRTLSAHAPSFMLPVSRRAPLVSSEPSMLTVSSVSTFHSLTEGDRKLLSVITSASTSAH